MASETLHIPLSSVHEAVVTITIRREGLGTLDPSTHGAPTLSEMETITRLLAARQYSLTSTLS